MIYIKLFMFLVILLINLIKYNLFFYINYILYKSKKIFKY